MGPDGSIGCIGTQSGTFGQSGDPFLTVNLLVECGALAPSGGPERTRFDSRTSGHWRRRLGAFLPGAEDRWWAIDAIPEWATEPTLAPIFGNSIDELADVIERTGVPLIEDLVVPAGLLRWWVGNIDGIADLDEWKAAARLAIALGDVASATAIRSGADELQPSAARMVTKILGRTDPGG